MGSSYIVNMSDLSSTLFDIILNMHYDSIHQILCSKTPKNGSVMCDYTDTEVDNLKTENGFYPVLERLSEENRRVQMKRIYIFGMEEQQKNGGGEEGLDDYIKLYKQVFRNLLSILSFIDSKNTYTYSHYDFFPRLKLLMLSSKMSHTVVLHLHDILLPSSVACGKFDGEDVDGVLVDRG